MAEMHLALGAQSITILFDFQAMRSALCALRFLVVSLWLAFYITLLSENDI